MSAVFVAKRYARALYEVAESKNVLDSVSENVDFIDSVVNGSKEIKKFCLETDSLSKIREFTDVLLTYKLNRAMVNFLNIVVENNRFALLVFLKEAFVSITEEKTGIANVFLETASIPNDDFTASVKKKFEFKLKSNVNITAEQNSRIVKGFRIFYKNRLIDNSALGRVRKMSNLLK